MTLNDIKKAFEKEFGFIQDKFEIMDLLGSNSPMDYDVISNLFLPTKENNIVWHPGVYFFFGNGKLYRVGVSMKNSRSRVMEHLKCRTGKDGYGIWDIDKYDDKSILLINVKKKIDRHWLLSIEAYFEDNFDPLIKASRIG